MTGAERVVFLFDVDDTLLDNDAALNDYPDHIPRQVGPTRRSGPAARRVEASPGLTPVARESSFRQDSER